MKVTQFLFMTIIFNFRGISQTGAFSHLCLVSSESKGGGGKRINARRTELWLYLAGGQFIVKTLDKKESDRARQREKKRDDKSSRD